MPLANKELTAKVRINAEQAHRTLDKLITKINKINSAVTKTASGGSWDKKITKAAVDQEKLNQATQKTRLLEQKVATEKQRTANIADQIATRQARQQEKAVQAAERRAAAERKVQNEISKTVSKENTAKSKLTSIVNSVKQWWSQQNKVNTATKNTGNILGSVGNKLKALIATYAGVMGTRGVLDTADTITGAKNRLNNLDGADQQPVSVTMDKIYAAAQRSRSGYGDMLSNVSKTMTLAGESFNNNIDNAIRFQEIMSKAYTVGGASAEEARTSMYQLVQALGSGVLQGDELRSVREGAPLAYKQIETFTQGLLAAEEAARGLEEGALGSTLSLKELASNGVVTADMVVGAIMDMENEINEKFDNTQTTFAQAFTNIKNMATQAFKPVLELMTNALNSEKGQRALQGLGNAFVQLANVAMSVLTWVGTAIQWVADNWNWLKDWVIAGLIAIVAYSLWQASITIAGWIAQHAAMIATIGIIALVAYAIVQLAQTTGDGCKFMVGALLIVGLALLAVGIISGNVAMWVIGAILLVAGVFVAFADYILAVVYTVAAAIYNTVIGVINALISAVWSIFVEPFVGLIEWCLNATLGGFDGWLGAIANMIGQVLSWLLGVGKVVTTIFDAVAGTNITGKLTGLQESLKSWGKNESSISISHEAPQLKRWAYTDAWSTGMSHGQSVQNWVGGIGSSIQGVLDGSALEGIGNIGDYSNSNAILGTNGLLDPNDPAYGLGGAYDPSVMDDDIANGLKKLGDIDDNVSGIKKSVDLSEEDLKYLRQVAEMEAINKFTTAEIKVDMTNNNTVNNTNDLDGIVTYLSDAIREEMDAMANGVHAY